MRWLGIGVGLLALACGGSSTQMANLAGRFAVFDCSPTSTDPDRSWCPVAAAGHGPFAAPAATTVRLGMTLVVHPRESPRAVIGERTSLSALYLGPDGAKVIDVRPSNAQEATDLAAVERTIASTLRGATPSVQVKQDLKAYLDGASGGLHPLTFDRHGATFRGMALPAEIQRVTGSPWGAAYVVVEQSFGSADSEAVISVFPDVDLVVLPE